ncbi:hypothetical protein O0L34_g18189 [Tuta absoluta]|nr:hypothetical protein O0L34_g18189 [Tuta absoluta]
MTIDRRRNWTCRQCITKQQQHPNINGTAKSTPINIDTQKSSLENISRIETSSSSANLPSNENRQPFLPSDSLDDKTIDNVLTGGGSLSVNERSDTLLTDLNLNASTLPVMPECSDITPIISEELDISQLKINQGEFNSQPPAPYGLEPNSETYPERDNITHRRQFKINVPISNSFDSLPTDEDSSLFQLTLQKTSSCPDLGNLVVQDLKT